MSKTRKLRKYFNIFKWMKLVQKSIYVTSCILSNPILDLTHFQRSIIGKVLLSLKSRIACSCCGQFFFPSPPSMPHGMCKPHWGNHDLSPLANGVYLRVIINKTPLPNGNCPITDPITEMRVAHTVGHWLVCLLSCYLIICHSYAFHSRDKNFAIYYDII